jgi:RecA-family ATPase
MTRLPEAAQSVVALDVGLRLGGQRQSLGRLVGSAGGGKSTMSTNYAVAIAFENPAVIGQSSIDWCGDVVIVSNEENENTVRRRIRAIQNKMGLSPDDQKHRIVIWPETLILGHAISSDGIAPTRAAVTFVDTLAQLNAESEIAFIAFDTLASLFSGLKENDAQMDKAVGMIADIAKAGFLTPDVIHHSSKAQDGQETAKSFRGSSAIGAKVREHSTIVPVPKNEWSAFGWSDDEGRAPSGSWGRKPMTSRMLGSGVSAGSFHVLGPTTFATPQTPRPRLSAFLRRLAT